MDIAKEERLKRLLLTIVIASFLLMLFRPFVVSQIVKRADGYLGYCMYKDAVRQYKKAFVLDPGNSRIADWLGYAYGQMGNKENAIRAYKEALKIDPENIIAYHDLGMVYAIDKRLRIAKEYFLKASSISRTHRDDKEYIFYYEKSLEMLSLCQEKLGEIEEAIRTNEKILELYPDNKLAQERIERLKR